MLAFPRPALILSAILIALGLAAAAAAAAGGQRVQCGQEIVLQPSLAPIPAGGLSRMATAEAQDSRGTITLLAGEGLAAHPEVLGAWQRAVDIWESWLEDPVNLVIEGDLQELAPEVLGLSTPRVLEFDFDEIRDAIVADAGIDESLIALLPTADQFAILIPPGFTYTGLLSASKANLKALGFDMSYDEPNPDGEIVFSLDYLGLFDFDSSDGILPARYDFEAVVVHEIGHALGFFSRVGTADYRRHEGLVDEISPSTLDLFRLLPGAGPLDFPGSPRVVTTGDLEPQQVTFEGLQELDMSTGIYLGDGRHGSHWKDDDFTGVTLGIMDPSLTAGVASVIGVNDIRLLGLIGWDMAPDCNQNGLADPYEIAEGLASDVNGNGIPDDCEATAVGEDAATRAAAIARFAVSPNPFNPMTTITFETTRDGPVQLTVHDLRGRRVRTLVDRPLERGEHRVRWDGRSEGGSRLASGAYRIVLAAGDQKRRQSITLVK